MAVERTCITSRRTLARVEKAVSVPPWPVVTELATLYGADARTRALLKELAIKAVSAGPGWSERFKAAGPVNFPLLPELEGEATSIDIYECEVLPGVLQTPDYATALMSTSPFIEPTQVDQQVAFRMKRRATVLPEAGVGPALRVLLTEGALQRQIGGPDVHQRQLTGLKEAADRAEVAIRYLSNTANYSAAVGPFTILRFDEPLDSDLVYLESLQEANYIETHEVVSRYAKTFDLSWQQGVEI